MPKTKGIRINGVDYESTIDVQGQEHGTTLGTQAVFNAAGQMGTYYLADNPNLFEIQRANNFKFEVNLDGIRTEREGNTASGQSNINEIFSQDTDIITIAVKKAFLPSFTQSPITVQRGNGKLKYAGLPDFGNGKNLELYDYIGAEVKDIMIAWQQKSYNTKLQKVGLASDYKRDATLYEYSPDQQLVRTWTLKGCWISGLTFTDPTVEGGSTACTVNATIEYDAGWVESRG